VKNRKAIEASRNLVRSDVIPFERDVCRVPTSSAIQAGCDQEKLNDKMRPGQVFEVKIVYALAKYLSFMVSLDAETQAGVEAA
jgi:hypothetical protein